MNQSLNQRSWAALAVAIFILINRLGIDKVLNIFRLTESLQGPATDEIILVLLNLKWSGYDNLPPAAIRRSYPMPLIRCRPRLVGSMK